MNMSLMKTNDTLACKVWPDVKSTTNHHTIILISNDIKPICFFPFFYIKNIVLFNFYNINISKLNLYQMFFTGFIPEV